MTARWRVSLMAVPVASVLVMLTALQVSAMAMATLVLVLLPGRRRSLLLRAAVLRLLVVLVVRTPISAPPMLPMLPVLAMLQASVLVGLPLTLQRMPNRPDLMVGSKPSQ